MSNSEWLICHPRASRSDPEEGSSLLELRPGQLNPVDDSLVIPNGYLPPAKYLAGYSDLKSKQQKRTVLAIQMSVPSEIMGLG